MKSITTTAVAAVALSTSSLSYTEAFAFSKRATKTNCLTLLEGKGFLSDDVLSSAGKAFAGAALALAVFDPSPAVADGQTKDFKLPPVDLSDKNRCAFVSSKMGQANAQRDKLYDLRYCNLSGQDATGFDLSGVIMTKTDVSDVKFVESQFSKGYLHDSNFDGADFSNGVVDRASFKGSSLRGAIFQNTVLSGTAFADTNLENSDFTDSYMGDFDQRTLCKNPTLKGENPVTGADTRASAGCGDR